MDCDDPEVKRDTLVNVVVDAPLNATDNLLTYFSDWSRLKAAVAWFLRLKAVLLELSRRRKDGKASNNAQVDLMEGSRTAITPMSNILTPKDLLEAELSIIHYCQQQRFGDEISSLSSGKGTVNRQSSIYELDPILESGLLRVGGRLSKGAMPLKEKHPVILSKDQYISKLILKHYHQRLGHSGRNHTPSALRRKYWISNATSAVRKVIAECTLCRRFKGKLIEQKIADLPRERAVPDLPLFTNVDVDYFGPKFTGD